MVGIWVVETNRGAGVECRGFRRGVSSTWKPRKVPRARVKRGVHVRRVCGGALRRDLCIAWSRGRQNFLATHRPIHASCSTASIMVLTWSISWRNMSNLSEVMLTLRSGLDVRNVTVDPSRDQLTLCVFEMAKVSCENFARSSNLASRYGRRIA